MTDQDVIAQLRQEVALLRGALSAQDERERLAGVRCGVTWELYGCDWPDAVAEIVIQLRGQTVRPT